MNEKTKSRGKIIGILGGMGPEATVEFFGRIIERTPVHRDQDHLRVIIYNNPAIPDRTQAILHGGEDPVPFMIDTAQVLECAGADLLAVPCNSAHYYLNAIRNAVRIPLLDMISETVFAIQVDGKVGLMATDGTLEVGLYHEAFCKKGIEVIQPGQRDQKEVMRVIYEIKAGKEKVPLRVVANKVMKKLRRSGANAIILGCTELSLIFNPHETGADVYDALDILAQAAVRKALTMEERGL